MAKRKRAAKRKPVARAANPTKNPTASNPNKGTCTYIIIIIATVVGLQPSINRNFGSKLFSCKFDSTSDSCVNIYAHTCN